MKKYGFILTSSYNLQCKVVAHLKVQESRWGWISVLLKCMERINKKNLSSMSIPALGTGQCKIDVPVPILPLISSGHLYISTDL